MLEAKLSPVKERLRLSGTVTAASDSALSPATSGLVAEILVDAGDRVDAQAALLKLDDELARYQLASDEAAAARARQALADARRRFAEAEELVPKQTIAETAVRDLESEVLEDEAELKRAEAVVGLRAAVLERHTLRAPFAGVVSGRSVDPGEWVTPGDTVLDLVSLQRLFIDFQVSEAYQGRIEVGSDAQIYFAGNDTVMYDARVAVAVPVSDPNARTFLLRLVLKQDSSAVPAAPGTSAIGVLALDAGRSAVTVPRDAVLRFSDGRSLVWIIESNNGSERAIERFVATGVNFNGLVEIRSGVRAGDRIVVEGNEALRNGQAVRVLND
ncbi:MAG: efflux RND transporter periplasmic adaptor subunit [Pseudomonadota bacterium]